MLILDLPKGLCDTLSEVIGSLSIYELRCLNSFMWRILWFNFVCKTEHIVNLMKLLTDLLANNMSDWTPVLTFRASIIKAEVQGTDGLSIAQAFTSLALISLIMDPAIALIQIIPQLSGSMANFFEAPGVSSLLLSRRQTQWSRA